MVYVLVIHVRACYSCPFQTPPAVLIRPHPSACCDGHYWSSILVTTVTTERNGVSVIALQTRSRGVLSAPPVCLPSLWFESDTNHFHFNVIALWRKIPSPQNSVSMIEIVFWHYSFRFFLILWIVYLPDLVPFTFPRLGMQAFLYWPLFFLSDTSGAGPWWRHCVIVAPWPQIVRSG